MRWLQPWCLLLTLCLTVPPLPIHPRILHQEELFAHTEGVAEVSFDSIVADEVKAKKKERAEVRARLLGKAPKTKKHKKAADPNPAGATMGDATMAVPTLAEIENAARHSKAPKFPPAARAGPDTTAHPRGTATASGPHKVPGPGDVQEVRPCLHVSSPYLSGPYLIDTDPGTCCRCAATTASPCPRGPWARPSATPCGSWARGTFIRTGPP